MRRFAIGLTVADLDTPLNALLLSASSSQQGIVSNSGLTFSGSGANRTLTINPNGRFGQTTITVTVNDNDGGSDEISFLYAAFESEPNIPPTITSIAPKTINENTSTYCANRGIHI